MEKALFKCMNCLKEEYLEAFNADRCCETCGGKLKIKEKKPMQSMKEIFKENFNEDMPIQFKELLKRVDFIMEHSVHVNSDHVTPGIPLYTLKELYENQEY